MDATSDLQKLADELIQVPDTAPDDQIDVEPTQEIESEDVALDDDYDADEDPSDNVEFDDAEDDDYDLTDEVAQIDYDMRIPVKVDGKDQQWTIRQLQQSAAGQGYINERMQEVAQLRKELMRGIEQISQAQQEREAHDLDVQANGLQEPTPPSPEMFDEDPIGYMRERVEYDQKKKAYDERVAKARQIQQQNEQFKAARLNEYTREQASLLQERLPEIADPVKGEAIKRGLMETGNYYGFTPQELGSVRDHRYILTMYDAMRYRQLVNKRGKATSQGESLPPVKAGPKKRPNSSQAAARKKAEARLQKTGSIEAALDALLLSNQ